MSWCCAAWAQEPSTAPGADAAGLDATATAPAAGPATAPASSPATAPETLPLARSTAPAAAPAPATGPATASPGKLSATRPAGQECPPITNVFTETDLRQALQDIATQAGVTIVADPTVGGVVTCDLKDCSLDKALEIVLAGSGYCIQKTPLYYLVYSADPKSPMFARVSKTRLVKLQYAEAEACQKLLSPTYRDYVQSNPKNNTMVITAPEWMVDRVCQDIEQIDQAPRHVMLEARVVVLEETELLNLGLRWDWPQLQAGIFTNSDLHGGGVSGPEWPWGVQIGYTPGREFTNSLLLTLNLLSQNDQATIVARPQIIAQDCKEAEIKVATDEYFQIATAGLYATSAQLEKIESGTILKIIPRIGANGEITLEMLVEVSDVVARGVNNLPVVSRRTARSTVRVHNGGTAAVAGLMDTRQQKIKTQTPGLGQLPGLGWLFTNNNTRQAVKQVAVFVTAHAGQDATQVQRTVRHPRPKIALVDKAAFQKELQDSMGRIDKESN